MHVAPTPFGGAPTPFGGAPTPFGGAGVLGGGERYPLELSRALVRYVDCELVTFGPRPVAVREPGGLQVRVLRSLALLHGHPAQPLAPQLALAVRRADVVHTHHTRSAPSRLAAVAGRAAGRRLVTTDHGLGGGGWHGLLPALFHRFLAVSAYAAAVLATPPDRTRVVHGGVDPERFRPDPDARREGVLFVGRLTPHKGIDRLLQALPADARLTVAGSGGHDPHLPERDYPHLLRRLATGHDVCFTGPVADEELPRLYRSARVSVLPSVHLTCYGRRVAISELLGLVALEAMASETPVVCSRVGGLPEVVVDGETGFVVEPGDVDGLRERIGQLLADPLLARRMGRAARAWVLERFTWDATARRCLAAYEELSGAR